MIVVEPGKADTSKFRGGWREILDILQRQGSEEQLQEYIGKNREKLEALSDETTRFIFAVINHLEYYYAIKEKGEVATVCKAFEDHYNTGVRDGSVQGIEQGEVLERRKMVFEFLEYFGTIPARIQDKVYRQDNLEILRSWSKIAAQVNSFADFEKQTMVM